MTSVPVPERGTNGVERERERDVRARRDATRRNAEKGIGPNLEDAIRLLRAADDFRAAFRTRR
jgi:hypothetical protein